MTSDLAAASFQSAQWACEKESDESIYSSALQLKSNFFLFLSANMRLGHTAFISPNAYIHIWMRLLAQKRPPTPRHSLPGASHCAFEAPPRRLPQVGSSCGPCSAELCWRSLISLTLLLPEFERALKAERPLSQRCQDLPLHFTGRCMTAGSQRKRGRGGALPFLFP